MPWKACLLLNGTASPIMHRICTTAFIASLGAALILGPNVSYGRSGAASGRNSVSMYSASYTSGMRSRVHAPLSSRRDRGQRNAGWTLWPAADGFYGINQSLPPSNVEPNVDVTRPISEHVTYTYDVPWDAVHRYPPVIRYASGCRSQTVTVPRGDRGKQSINIVRCY